MGKYNDFCNKSFIIYYATFIFLLNYIIVKRNILLEIIAIFPLEFLKQFVYNIFEV